MAAPRAARSRGPIALVALGLGLLLSGVRCDSMSSEELACENAVARVERCCPQVEKWRIRCEHVTGGECGPTYVGIPEGEADCLAKMSCADVEAAGTCERVRFASYSAWGWGGPTCP